MDAIASAASEATGAKRRGGAVSWLVAVLAGVGGSLGGVAALGNGTYDVTPLTVELRVTPLAGGTTSLGLEPLGVVEPGSARASTHSSPVAFKATVVGVDAAGLAGAVVGLPGAATSEQLDLDDPYSLARYLGQNGRSAVRSFAIKVGAIALAAGFAVSLLAGLGNWKKAVAGAIAGVVALGALALGARQTYDTTAFRNTRFERSANE